MRHFVKPCAKRPRQRGLSLIELAVIMIIVSLALAPIVRQIGGARNNTAGSLTQGNTADRIVAQKAKEVLLANTLIDKTLAGDYKAFNCGGSFDPKANFPGPNLPKNFPASTRCVSNNYNQPLYYQWSIRNQDLTGQKLPVGNHYYSAVLNVWSTPTGGTPMLTLPTSFYWNETSVLNTQGKTGVIVVLDQSSSMGYGKDFGTSASLQSRPMCEDGKYPASPFLRYRFQDPSAAGGAYSPPGIANLGNNIYDNSKLDIVSLWQANDNSTFWDDRYMKQGIWSVPSCGSIGSGTQLFDFNGPWRDTKTENINHSKNLCSITAPQESGTWNATVDDNLSRIEVARSSLLAFLLALERDSDLYNNSKLAFLTYSSEVFLRVPFEGVDAGGHFPNNRRKFTWINRSAGGRPSARFTQNGPINAIAYTNMYVGVQTAANALFADKSLNSRIMILVSDGQPECSNTHNNATCPHTNAVCEFNHGKFTAMGTQIGNGTYPGSGGNKATIFSLGLMSQAAEMPAYLRDDLALRTPGGQYFHANSIAEVRPVFEQIQYQIQRIILLNKVGRYNVNFT